MDYMARALQLAARSRGRTGSNPAVGALLVKDGVVVGEGSTQPVGQAHAEIMALRDAGDLARGATLYTSLEPCCHYGRTPPCCKAIIDAGVAEVHMAMLDPNPLVAGGGRAALDGAGITTVLGEHEDEARRSMEAWLTFITLGRPYVIAKYAMTLDGKIACSSGHSQWITGPNAREEVQRMRAESDAIMVGVDTAIMDNPQLTVRNELGEQEMRQPLRLIVDSTGRIPLDLRVMSGELPGRTVLIVGEDADPERLGRIESHGARLIRVPRVGGRVDLESALKLLAADWSITSVLVEGGGKLLGSLFDRQLVDKVVAFVAPKIVGGAEAPGPVGGTGVQTMEQAVRLSDVSVRYFEGDLMITGYVVRDVHRDS